MQLVHSHRDTPPTSRHPQPPPAPRSLQNACFSYVSPVLSFCFLPSLFLSLSLSRFRSLLSFRCFFFSRLAFLSATVSTGSCSMNPCPVTRTRITRESLASHESVGKWRASRSVARGQGSEKKEDRVDAGFFILRVRKHTVYRLKIRKLARRCHSAGKFLRLITLLFESLYRVKSIRGVDAIFRLQFRSSIPFVVRCQYKIPGIDKARRKIEDSRQYIGIQRSHIFVNLHSVSPSVFDFSARSF